MKYLLVLAVVLVGVWIWRNNRRVSGPAARSGRPAAPRPALEMVACRVCGVHVAANEAIAGRLGPYCSNEHHQRAEP